ncbi:hypothetical protein SAMD00019534_028760 [Acytostelium subglobosum LB1]|uniref:hypothetical protein n=1 Tax=Acytostelium subglobosum LB1 TaxID=1410327 RepID=UPI000644D531|nr:hypothetical protein SAMD00019534_028760 [Acytostelium subglobosum LB1]GAM19701.1 hypothetical protein SAMD00019534_028760 [Acytostelium subglobosum LB1]|eukprot:XP_012756463.1 hypothetical protein SAMD00019534_028760 [Acytostelium subglobosum LB1]
MSNKRGNSDDYNNNNNNNNNNYGGGGGGGGGPGGLKKRRPDNNDHDVVGSLLGDMQVQKEANQQGKQPKSTFSAKAVIDRIIQLCNAEQGQVDKLEVEARLGLLTSTFKSGTIQEDFSVLMERLTAKHGKPVETHETDHIFDDYRIVYDEDLKQVVRKESKADRTTFNLPTNLIYDIRVSVSVEHQLPVPLNLPESGVRQRRYKARSTFKDSLWKIDMTQVTTLLLNDQQEATTYEVEIELLPTAIQNTNSIESVHDLLNQFLAETKSLISLIQPQQTLSFPDVEMEKVTAPQEVMHLKDIVFKYIPNVNTKKTDTFPGSMPINFGKKHFRYVQANDYYVSEKTDGVRYLLLITNDTIYMIDRKFDFYTVAYPKLLELYGNDTLLDGEMIRHLKTKRPIYLVFDILSHGGTPVGAKKLSARLEAIRNSIMVPFTNHIENQNLPIPFILWAKNFHPKTQLDTVFKSVRNRGGGDRTFEDHKRNHNTDGIIFTPNTPYTPYTQQDLYKWKYLDKWTIDYRVVRRDNQREPRWFLTCLGRENTDVDCREINFSSEDLDKLRRDYTRARDPNTVIVECSYQANIGRWKYHMVRQDKVKPNYISIVMDTMESIAEAITAEELQFRVPLSADNDNWDEEMSRMRATLLANIKKKSGSSSSSSSSSSSRHHQGHHQSSSSSLQAQHQQQQQQQSRSSAYYQGSNYEGDPFGGDDDTTGSSNQPAGSYQNGEQQEYI